MSSKKVQASVRTQRTSRRDRSLIRPPPSEFDPDAQSSRSVVGTVIPPVVKEWYESTLTKSVRTFVHEFQAMRSILPPNLSVNAYKANTEKNRYRDVLCMDETRVILKDNPAGGDYIHANWMPGCKGPQQFICTQGPTEKTAADFWHMVVQEKVAFIVMLCGVVEKGRPKCLQYWPEVKNKTLVYGAYTVLSKGTKPVKIGNSNCLLTSLKVYVTEQPESKHIVPHCQWAEWPDRGVPPDSKTLVTLRRRFTSKANAPVIIHCSAGIGRTGTMVALDICLGSLEKRPPAPPDDIPKIVQRIRESRLHSVQNELQYVFIYRSLIDYITLKYHIPQSTPGLREFWAAHKKLQMGK